MQTDRQTVKLCLKIRIGAIPQNINGVLTFPGENARNFQKEGKLKM